MRTARTALNKKAVDHSVKMINGSLILHLNQLLISSDHSHSMING